MTKKKKKKATWDESVNVGLQFQRDMSPSWQRGKAAKRQEWQPAQEAKQSHLNCTWAAERAERVNLQLSKPADVLSTARLLVLYIPQPPDQHPQVGSKISNI